MYLKVPYELNFCAVPNVSVFDFSVVIFDEKKTRMLIINITHYNTFGYLIVQLMKNRIKKF